MVTLMPGPLPTDISDVSGVVTFVFTALLMLRTNKETITGHNSR